MLKAQPHLAAESILLYQPDPLLCCAWVCPGHPKSSSQALRLQQFPRSKPAMDTGEFSSHLQQPETHPACSDPALQLIFWSLQVSASAPHTLAQPLCCRKSPGPGSNTLIPHTAPPYGSQPRTEHPQTKAQHPARPYLESCCAQESQTSHPSRLLTSSQQL